MMTPARYQTRKDRIMPRKVIGVPQQLDQRVKSLASRMKISEAEVYRRAAEAFTKNTHPDKDTFLDPQWQGFTAKSPLSADPDADLYGDLAFTLPSKAKPNKKRARR
jgi:hypothetical protein